MKNKRVSKKCFIVALLAYIFSPALAYIWSKDEEKMEVKQEEHCEEECGECWLPIEVSDSLDLVNFSQYETLSN